MPTRDAYKLCTDTRANLEALITAGLLLESEICVITDENSALGKIIGGVLVNIEQGVAKLDAVQTFTLAQRGAVLPVTIAGGDLNLNFALSNNFSCTVDANFTLQNPTNVVAGQSGRIHLPIDGTGGYTASYGANWVASTDADMVIDTAAGANNMLAYEVLGPTQILVSLIKNIGAIP